jgi:hypothetical protein
MQPGHGAYNNKDGDGWVMPLPCYAFELIKDLNLSIIIGRLLSQIEYGQNGS